MLFFPDFFLHDVGITYQVSCHDYVSTNGTKHSLYFWLRSLWVTWLNMVTFCGSADLPRAIETVTTTTAAADEEHQIIILILMLILILIITTAIIIIIIIIIIVIIKIIKIIKIINIIIIIVIIIITIIILLYTIGKDNGEQKPDASDVGTNVLHPAPRNRIIMEWKRRWPMSSWRSVHKPTNWGWVLLAGSYIYIYTYLYTYIYIYIYTYIYTYIYIYWKFESVPSITPENCDCSFFAPLKPMCLVKIEPWVAEWLPKTQRFNGHSWSFPVF